MGDGDGHGSKIAACGGRATLSGCEASAPAFSFPATSTLAISALATRIGATSGRSMTGLAIRIDAMKLHGICGVTGIVSAQTAPVGAINAPMANRAGALLAENLIRFPPPSTIRHRA